MAKTRQTAVALLYLAHLYSGVLARTSTRPPPSPVRTIVLLTTPYRSPVPTVARTLSTTPSSAQGPHRTTKPALTRTERPHTDRSSSATTPASPGTVPSTSSSSSIWPSTTVLRTSTVNGSTLSTAAKSTTKLTTKSTVTRTTTGGTTKTTTVSKTASTTTTSSTPLSDGECPPGTYRVWHWISDYVPSALAAALLHVNSTDTAGQCHAACTGGSRRKSCISYVFRPAERKCSLYAFRFLDDGITFIKAKTEFFFESHCRNFILPQCPLTQQLPVLRYARGQYYDPGSGYREEVDTAITLDQCLDSCIATWDTERKCQSVSYGKEKGTVCKLNYRSSDGKELSRSAYYDFYEYTCFKDPDICSSRTQSNRVWFAFTNRSYAIDPDENDIISGVKSYVGCQNLCFYHRGRMCKSVVYRPDTGQCLMYNARYEQRKEIGLNVYQYQCPEKNIKQCSSNMELIWAQFQGRTLPEHHDHVIADVDTARECQQRCLNMSSWVCKSIVYDVASKSCILSGTNREQTALVVTGQLKDRDVSYYEWLCKLETCFGRTEKVYFVLEKKLLKYRDDAVYEGVTTFRECLMKCAELTTFTCRSLEYSDKTLVCRLSEVTAAEAEEGELVDSNTEQYNYVEWRCRNYETNPCQGQSDSVLYWSEVPRSRLQGGYIKKSTNVHSQGKCEELCFTNTQCRSVEYQEATSDCRINNANTDIKDVMQSNDDHKYLEWRCAKPQYKPCHDDEENYWEAFVGRRYHNPSKLTITKVSVSTLIACQLLCLKAKQGGKLNCESVQYHYQNRTCYVFSGTARRDQLVPDDINIVYLERHCRKVKFSRCTPGTRFLPNITVQGRALSTDPHAMAYKSSSPVECQTLCEYHRIFQCESVDYSSANKECVLHAVRQIDGLKTVVSPSYNHYEMGCVVPVMPATGDAEKLVHELENWKKGKN
ncbi:hypothetical protein LSH36_29g00009 [Paralvinella palmiformis]|uniref:Apple domain-containing protein n=1 Tax=Paralvinella palmiformis TaxID=53620 RepID=A0AAD9KBA8_9ANNE|nr:hypothetical protein LSH36_29g00009 [Paralvinella palmiformis]